MSWYEEERAPEDLATAVKIAKDKDLPILSISILNKKTKLATLVLNLVTLDQ